MRGGRYYEGVGNRRLFPLIGDFPRYSRVFYNGLQQVQIFIIIYHIWIYIYIYIYIYIEKYFGEVNPT